MMQIRETVAGSSLTGSGEIPVLDAAVSEVFAGADVPEILRPSLERHRENLLRLVQSLHEAGVDEAQIELSVHTVVASYKAELLAAVKSLMKVKP